MSDHIEALEAEIKKHCENLNIADARIDRLCDRVSNLQAAIREKDYDLNIRAEQREALYQENKRWRSAAQDVVANRGTNIPLEASIDALAEALEADDV